ncbi:ferredoxin [Kribbella steppae]|uniref:Ferredoxin n=1 Tax=Kribbella steppae TaxID=2512223 RepID=A0A4R2HE31_9ACTN|nr:ferredoxin [Kribbella steppae]
MNTANKVEIDWTRCDGHGLCATLLPDDVALDEWGFPVLRGREITAGELPHARRAVLACPALALRLDPPVERD